MSRVVEMLGRRFDRLVVIGRIGSRHGKAAFVCACECGNRSIVVGAHLREKMTKSCGCLTRAGRVIPDETRAKISASLKGKPWSAARRAAYEKGETQ